MFDDFASWVRQLWPTPSCVAVSEGASTSQPFGFRGSSLVVLH